jgi:enterobacteria phage integrase
MAARPRIRKRANWPTHLHEPRPGYYVWKDPRDGKTHVLGRMPLAQAIHEAQEANMIVESAKASRSLAERLEASNRTVADLITRMSTEDLKPSTIRARADYDKVISAKLGGKDCSTVTTSDVSDVLEEIKKRGKQRWAQAIRSRMIALFSKGVALGWMDKNPASVTEEVKAKVKRKRLTLEQFNAILKEAPGVAPWLANTMLLALVSGQDRSTVAAWPRSAVKDGEAIVMRKKTQRWIAIPVALRMASWKATLDSLALSGCRVEFQAKRYRPFPLWLKGLLMEPVSAARREVIPGGSTWALYGFESVIWARKE